MSGDRRTPEPVSAVHSERRTRPGGVRRWRLLVPVSVALLLAATPPVAAEWLVLKDGSEIETKGPWKVDGRRITYTAMNGTFSAVRTDSVDLEKSRIRNEPVAETKPAAPAVKEPGLVVRQSDVRTARQPDQRSAGEEVDAPADEDGRIAVVEWDEVVVQTGTRLEGRLRNDTQSTYLALAVDAKLLGEDGQELDSVRASLEKNWIGRGEVLRFRADFENVIAFDTVRFEVNGQPMGRATDNSLVSQDRPGQEPDPQATTTEPPR